MGFFDFLNGELERAFKRYAKTKNPKKAALLELTYTPFLFSSEYLNDLVDDCNQSDYDHVLDYLYRFHNHPIGENEHLDILELDSYKNIEQKIINKRWK